MVSDASHPFSEGAVTRLRREFKLVLPPTEAEPLCQRLLEEIGGPRPPSTRIVSVYFDRPGLPLGIRARERPDDCLKIRTKEYAPDLGAGGRSRVVLEAKRERNGLTRKRRTWVARDALASLLAAGAPGLLPLIGRGTLMPVLAVSYARQVYQVAQGWRVTVDREIAFHTASRDQVLGPRPLDVTSLERPFFREGRLVIEIKHVGHEALPAWIAALKGGGGRGYSKFAEGMERRMVFGVPGSASGALGEGAQGRVHRL